MEIIRSFKTIKWANCKIQFDYVCYVVKQDGSHYTGKWRDVDSRPQAVSDLSDVQELHKTLREDQYYHQVKICEFLQDLPHPNVGVYHGCYERGGYITSITSGRYMMTFALRVNPRSLSKEDFRASEREKVDEIMTNGLSGVLAGIRHLHENGLAHNNINPRAIMLAGDSSLVIVDFRCSGRLGEPLPNCERAPHWHDPKVEVSRKENDLDAYEELRTWLVGSAEDQFRFE
ncbi:uncharacterized protein BO80DRAFT_458387 [Aspergillus ibericus CBS 121593]|uniref:Protein kinase domain-containing protein n=1 Tax=Aspergillus ibericus CBS 121593 TaxID=1448316 RepID=A0A395GNL0_9EURO|nr:hypothetical protein BO80DRAFT_458387 [Aspergillus ibericus CBS 121593]RAK97090.1 hypothetical protein BO80DRAFT_458387 [Aspergillus ibericus CBS 121593]